MVAAVVVATVAVAAVMVAVVAATVAAALVAAVAASAAAVVVALAAVAAAEVRVVFSGQHSSLWQAGWLACCAVCGVGALVETGSVSCGTSLTAHPTMGLVFAPSVASSVCG